MIWTLRSQTLSFPHPRVMGILNVTPDSFSDGGRYTTVETAVARGLQLATDGADILDIGGESTRPGSDPVPLDDELARVIPVVEALAKQLTIPISVDTSKAEVARRALLAGAEIVNDVTGLEGDPAMPAVCRDFACGVVVMHMRGTPKTMQDDPTYTDVVADILGYFVRRLKSLSAAGIDQNRVCLDPGIGFGKTQAHNLTLLANLHAFRDLGRPVLLGASRKGYLKELTGRERPDRLAGTLATSCFAFPAADVVRVHDVAEHRDAVLVYEALQKYRHA